MSDSHSVVKKPCARNDGLCACGPLTSTTHVFACATVIVACGPLTSNNHAFACATVFVAKGPLDKAAYTKLASAVVRLENILIRNRLCVATGVMSTLKTQPMWPLLPTGLWRRLPFRCQTQPIWPLLPTGLWRRLLHHQTMCRRPLGHPKSLRLALAILGLRPWR